MAVVKQPGTVLVFLNGQIAYSSANPNLGGQASEIVLGASTYRGVRKYGEFFSGSIAEMSVWPVALGSAGVREVFQEDAGRYLTTVDVPLDDAALLRTRPNPFQKRLDLEFALARPGEIEITIFGVDGRRVRRLAHGHRDAGPQRVSWDGKDDRGRRMEAGVYFARLVAPGARVASRLVLLK